MSAIVARRPCEIVERTGFVVERPGGVAEHRTGMLASCAEAKSSRLSVTAPVSQNHSQGLGGAGGAQSSGSSGPFWSPS
jgi:hypothetical protein